MGIKKFEEFISSAENSKISEGDHKETVETSIAYKGYYITIWPFRNEEMNPSNSWGFTVSDNPEGENYLSKTKGPAGNYSEAVKGAKDIIDRLTSK